MPKAKRNDDRSSRRGRARTASHRNVHPVLQLQELIGNRAVAQLIGGKIAPVSDAGVAKSAADSGMSALHGRAKSAMSAIRAVSVTERSLSDAVQRDRAAKSARAGRTAAAKKAIPPTSYVFDAKGTVYIVSPTGQKSPAGFKKADGSLWSAAAAPPPLAGTLRLGGTDHEILKLSRIAVAEEATEAGKGPGDSAIGTDARPVQGHPTDDSAGYLYWEQKPILVLKPHTLEPVPPDELPAGLKTKLSAGTGTSIDVGKKRWALMNLRLGSEDDATLRWVETKQGFVGKRALIEEEAKSADLTAKARKYLNLVGAVMTHEGGFGSRSTKGDNTASLGIFQWGMKKVSHKGKAGGAGSSLYKFFATLKRRATDAQKKQKDRTPAEQLYIDAWAELHDPPLKLDTSDAQGKEGISIGGTLVAGEKLEELLAGKSGAMSQGSLKTYQLEASADWIESFSETVVQPVAGSVGKRHLGLLNGLSLSGPTATLSHSSDGRQYKFVFERPSGALTVGDVLVSERALAAAVIIGVNRPLYVSNALWMALTPDYDSDESRLAAMNELVGLQLSQVQATPAEAAPAKGKKHSKHEKKPKAVPVVIDKNLVARLPQPRAKELWKQLQETVWPPRGDLSETEIVAAFQAAAVELYERMEPWDRAKFHRERRLATAEAWVP